MAFVLFGSIPIAHAADQKPPCAKLPEDHGIIKQISTLNIITLEDGRKLTLANIKLSKENNQANANIKKLIGQRIMFYPSGRIKDRHNRLIVQVVTKRMQDQSWLQLNLVANGQAQVYALPNNRLCVKELLVAEKIARDAKRGEWADTGQFHIRKTGEVNILNKLPQGSFQIVSGTLFGVGGTAKNTYLNFSNDWSKDFTAVIKTSLLRRKSTTWPKLKTLIGKPIRIRGWLDHWNGPMIRLDSPEMLEVIE